MPLSESTEFYLSGALFNQEALKFFELARANSPTAQLVQRFPALTLQTQAMGPNGRQLYEVSPCKVNKKVEITFYARYMQLIFVGIDISLV